MIERSIVMGANHFESIEERDSAGVADRHRPRLPDPQRDHRLQRPHRRRLPADQRGRHPRGRRPRTGRSAAASSWCRRTRRSPPARSSDALAHLPDRRRRLTPFAKTGGLGDVVAGLSRALGSRRPRRPRLPALLLRASRRCDFRFTPVEFLRDVEIAARRDAASPGRCSRRSCRTSGVDVYFVHCPALYHHDAVYIGDWDEYLRFALLTRATFESCQRMGWSPDILHAHDWHTALVPLYLQDALRLGPPLRSASRTVLTLHNLGYQGVFGAQVLDELGLAAHAAMLHQEDLAAGRVSFLTTGLLYADVLTTVSRTYAREIQTPEHGFGLDPMLRARADHLVGIVNGVDYGEWDPGVDPHIPHALHGGDARRQGEEQAGAAREDRPAVRQAGAGARAGLAADAAEGARPALRHAAGVPLPPRPPLRGARQRRGALRVVLLLAADHASRARPGTTAATTSRWRTGSRRAPTSS